MKIAQTALFTLIAVLLSGCQSFEYAEDIVEISENTIYVSNVGFKGFRLTLPDGYQRLTDQNMAMDPEVYGPVESFHRFYRNSEGTGYHFHQDFTLQVGEQIIFVIPFQDKRVRQFRHTPPDILERYLVDWVRRAELSKITDLDLAWRTQSDSNGHSTVILKSKKPKNGWVYEEHVMTGDQNEMFIFAGYAQEQNFEALSYELQRIEKALTVIR